MIDDGLAALLANHATAHAVPGAAIGVLRDGHVAVACYGLEDVRTGVPVTTASRFSAGSLTKTMVATVALRLCAQGRLSLDDPIASRVPELRGASWAERSTIRDLLASRSGGPLRVSLEFDFDAYPSDDDVLSRFASSVAAEEPTPVPWSYTNAGWSLTGRAIETATGRVWENAMREELFIPLELRDTTFATASRPGPRVSGHRPTTDGPVPDAPLTARALGPAGTTLLSTIGDLLTFAATHLDDPDLAALRAPQPSPGIHGYFDGWCLGMAWFDWDGVRAWGWDGIVPGERAFLRLVPDRRAAIVLLANGERGRPMSRSLIPELMRTWFAIGVPPLPLDPTPGSAGELGRYAGVYAWPDRRVEVTATEDRLLIHTAGGDTGAFPIDERTFLVDRDDPDTPAITFDAFDGAGRPHVLYEMLWGLPRVGA